MKEIVFIDAAGTNTYTASPSPTVDELKRNVVVVAKFANGNTGASTLSLNGGDAWPIWRDGSAVVSGSISSSYHYLLAFDGLRFHIVGTSSASGGGGGATSLNELTDVTISGAASGDLLRHDGTDFKNTPFTASLLPSGIDATKIGAGSVSNTEFGYLDGVTSALQTQLDGKAATSHSHAISDTTGLQTALDAKAASSHAHAISDTTGLQTALDGKLSLTGGDLSGNIRFTDDAKGITADTEDGSDNQSLILAGGGDIGISRGGSIHLCGNEHPTYPGRVLIQPGYGIGNPFEACQVIIGAFDGSPLFTANGWTGTVSVAYNFVSGHGITTGFGITANTGDIQASSGNFLLPGSASFSSGSQVGIGNGGATGRLEYNSTDRHRFTHNGNLQVDLQEGLHIHRPRTAAVNNGANSSAITASTDKGGLITVINTSDSKSAIFRWETGAAPTLVSGDSGHWATTDTGSRACLIDSGSGVLVIKNNLGSSKNFSVHAIVA